MKNEQILRDILAIDESKCNGCGLCVSGCAEAAIAIIDGKAKIISDNYCDGLGACLGACPTGALSITQRLAPPFDEEAALAHAVKINENEQHSSNSPCPPQILPNALPKEQSRPSCFDNLAKLSELMQNKPIESAANNCAQPSPPSPLEAFRAENPMPAHWPLKLRLISPAASQLEGADLLIAADCAPAACKNFHTNIAENKTLLIGCPKFDNVELYIQKLTEIFSQRKIKSCTVLRMSVPCCSGLALAAETAAANCNNACDNAIEINHIVMNCDGSLRQG